MKRILLLFSLLFLFNNWSHAQNYQSIFGTQSTSWVIRWSNLPGPAVSTISVQKDTVVNNKAYKKIISSDPSSYRGGLLREDRVAGKVWYKSLHYSIGTPNPSDTLERLAFDYNLSKGDTFDISSCWFGFSGTYPDSFNIVDTVYYLNNLKYIEFKAPLNNFFYPERFSIIEGIGSNLGILLKHYISVMGGQYLLCSYKDGVKTSYINKQYNGSCSITGIAEHEAEVSEIKVYPNPAQDFLTINIDSQLKAKEIRIINTLGQTVFLKNKPVNQEINILSLAPGLYFVQIAAENGEVYFQKFIKQAF